MAFTKSSRQRDWAQGAGGTGWFLLEEESDIIIFCNEFSSNQCMLRNMENWVLQTICYCIRGDASFLNSHMFVDGMGPCNKSLVARSKECTFLNTCSAHQREKPWWKARNLSSLAFMTFPTKNTIFHRNSKTKAMDFESLWAQMMRRQLNDRQRSTHINSSGIRSC